MCSETTKVKARNRNTTIEDKAKQKMEGQHMTPPWITKIILDEAGFFGNRIIHCKIMEPSFGDGAFLVEIANRIIKECQLENLDSMETQNILVSNMFGIEKDEELYHRAIQRLNCLLSDHGIPVPLEWVNLICGDTMLLYQNFIGKMDIVVGNPPFVNIHNIPQESRKLAKTFKFSKGTTDLYIIFYEIGLSMLAQEGILGYISPNSFLMNSSQQYFRDTILKGRYLSVLYDFKGSKVFPVADTYTCITILKKRGVHEVHYREYQEDKVETDVIFPMPLFQERYKGRSWSIGKESDMEFLDRIRSRKWKMKNIASVQNGISTNANYIYMVEAYLEEDLKTPYIGKHSDKKRIVYFYNKNSEKVHPIESSILHRCVKASVYDGSLLNSYVIFPYLPMESSMYFYPSGKPMSIGYTPMEESFFQENYPLAYQYLSLHRKTLETRDMEKKTLWFHYARSQGMRASMLPKIVFKHFVPGDPFGGNALITPYFLASDVIVHSVFSISGNLDLCITPLLDKDENPIRGKFVFHQEMYDLLMKEIYHQINSPDFAFYCRLNGKDKAGGYVEVHTKTIAEYGVDFSNLIFSM